MGIDNLAEHFDMTPVLDVHLFYLSGTSITVATLITFALIIGVTFVVSWLVQRAVAKAFAVRGVGNERSLAAMSRLVHYLLLAAGIGIAVETVGIDLSALFAAGAVFAIGLGFAMQNIAQNFVSGMILLLERSIKPGDVLEVEGRMVKVSRMGIRATEARTLDDEEIIVPNAQIVQSTVTNYTLRDSAYRLRCAVGVSYDSDMAEVRRALESMATGLDWRLDHKAPVVYLTAFGNSSVDWEVSVWIDDPWAVNRRRSQLFEAIWWELKRAGITIAYPQVDVHLDPPVTRALGGIARPS